MIDDMYKTNNLCITTDENCIKYLSSENNYIYKSNLRFIVAIVDMYNKIRGCIIENTNTYEFTIECEKKITDIKTIKKIIKKNIDINSLSYVKDSFGLQKGLMQFCENYSFSGNKLYISIIYIKDNQIGIDTIFNNNYTSSSGNYKSFLQKLNISDSFDEDNVYDDIYDDHIKIRWYPSTHMDSEQIRRYVGNTQCVIIYYDDVCLSKEIMCKIFGKVNQIFICVSHNLFNNNYKINVIHKDNVRMVPLSNFECIYGYDDIYNIILKLANELIINLKKYSDISEMYTYPRKIALEKITVKYL